jgi:L-ascorbate metabolism protein UlaG (beta-lactamase superfamily)
MVGFDTIGNAILIAYDDQPVLVTDPWVGGGAYFGSWTFSHAIPPEQLESIKRSPYVWISHGHPDHLNLESLSDLPNKQFLLANHVGGRIHDDLKALGINVRILPEREWVQLSKRVKVMTLSDYNQDSILLVDMAGTLLIDINDANDRGWGSFVKGIASQYKTSYLLKLSDRGDADMINLFDEGGRRKPLSSAAVKVGRPLARWAKVFGATHVIPFSSFHRYQREDSVWANEYATTLEAYKEGFDTGNATLLPAFVRVDCENGTVTELTPPASVVDVKPASAFGDNWSDLLEPADKLKLTAYFQDKQILRSHFGFLRFIVGGEETMIDLNPGLRDFGITFEVPRSSLMTAVEYQVFDDLLIGNFMRTTLHGATKLYPHFTPLTAKYSDNGRANTSAELRNYFFDYIRRNPAGTIRHLLELKSEDLFRKLVPINSGPYKKVQALYWKYK